MRRLVILTCCCALTAEEAVGPAPAPAPAEPPAPAAAPGFTPIGDVLFIDEQTYVEAVSRRRQALSAAPQAVTVIDYGGEFRPPPWTVPDRLRYESGIDVYQRRHGQFDVGIRGFNAHNSTRTLVVRDGQEITVEELGQVPWISHLHPSDIGRIEVVKGPSSVTYGANAFGGVIALAGRPVGDVHEQHVTSDIGGDGLLDVDATVLGPVRFGDRQRGWYKFSAGGARRDDFDGTRGTEPVDHPLATQTGEADLRAIRGRGEFGLTLSEGVSLAAELAWVDVDDWDMVESFSPGSNQLRMKDLSGGLRLELPYGELRWHHSDNQRYYATQRSVFDPAVHGIEQYKYSEIGLDAVTDRLRAQADVRFGEHSAAAGIEWTSWRGESNFWDHDATYADRGSWGDADYENLAVFLEDQWEPDRHWVLNAGLRYDDHSEVGGNWSPRVAVNYRFDDEQFVRLAYSAGYRLPTPFELYIDEWFFASADDLDVETVQSLDIGWTRQLPAIESRFQLGAFYSRADDPIALSPLDEGEMQANWLGWLATGPDVTRPPGPFFEYRNLDTHIDIFGLEAEWRSWFHGRRGQAWFSATWQDVRWDERFVYQSDGFTDPLSGATIFTFDYDLGHRDAPPPLKLNLGGSYDWGGWFASGVLRWVDEQDFFVFSAAYFLDGRESSMYHRPSYWSLDLGLGYNWGREEGLRRFVRLSVLDVFDQDHYESTRVDEATLAGDVEWQWSSSIGRQIALVAAWEF